MTRSRKRKLARIRALAQNRELTRNRGLARHRAHWATMPLASAMLAGGGAAYAADPVTEAPEQGTLEEVVVTAQKRVEDLQKVPISLTVLNTEKLEQLQVNSFDDYAKFLPSLAYNSIGPGQAELFFRGIGGGTSNSLHAGYLPSTGLYLDEIPVTTIGGSLDLHVYDMARVEALAGPQGTLYGASSLSGTLRLITNKPDPSAFSAAYDIKATSYGRGNNSDGGGVEGYVNIPLSDTIAVRLVGYYEHDGGYLNNVYTQNTFQRFGQPPQGCTNPLVCGTPVASSTPDGHPVFDPITVNNAPNVRSNYNDVDAYGGRAALKVDLNDQWSITPTVLYQHLRTHGDFSFDPLFSSGGNAVMNSADYYLPSNEDNWYQTALTVEGKISNWDVVLVTGYFGRKVEYTVDYSQYSIAYDQKAILGQYHYTRFLQANGQLLDNPTQYTLNNDSYTKWSNELRVSSPQGYRFRVTTGLFYQRQTDDIRAEFRIPNLPVYYEVTGQQDIYYLSQQERVDRDYAVFADSTFDVTDKFKISTGIRGFWVNNTLIGFFGFNDNGYSSSGEAICVAEGNPIVTKPGVYTGGVQPCENTNKKAVENGETHRVVLTYQIDPDHMVYGTYSTGFRPGGNNRRPEALTYQPDRLTNFEVGWKTAWLNNRLRVNGAAYYEKWIAAQTSVQGLSGITAIINAGNARVEGIESELIWLATDHLTLTASATGLLKSETTTTFCSPTPLGTAVSTCAPNLVAAPPGTQLPVTPRTKANGTARYRFNVDSYDSFVQGSVIHQGSTTYSLLQTSANQFVPNTPPFTTFDMSVGTGMNNWTIEAYAANLFDKRGQIGRNSECADTPGYCWSHTKVLPIAPFNFGVKFAQKF